MRRLRYLRAGARALGAAISVTCLVAIVIAASAAVSACGPAGFLTQVNGRATRAVADAARADAESDAPYEYTAAVAYLRKAREEGGHAEYQVAIEYGHRAEDFANRARTISDEKRRNASLDGRPSAPVEPSGGSKDSP